MGASTSLLIGNGVNQLADGRSMSWEAVLRELAKMAGKPELIMNSNLKPFAILYEAIVATRVEEDIDVVELSVKERVAKLVQDIPPNDYHKKIEELGCRHILTTNYDYNIGSEAKSANLRRETKYSAFRRRVSNSTQYWMIHGEANKPNTIMLGSEHYIGAVQKLRNYLFSGKDGPLPYSSPFMKGEPDFEESGKPFSWVDVFLRDDIKILGLGMDYTEIELWWLLAFKARLRRQKKLPVGTTEFYMITGPEESDLAAAKAELMQSLDVRVNRRHVENKEYAPHYDWAIGEIGRRLGTG